MKTKWMSIIAIVFMVCSLCDAQLCGKIKQVSAGEDHSLALMENGSLMACGSNGLLQLGVGQGASYSTTILQKVRGIAGAGYLKKVATFDAGWKHSLAADSNGVLVSWRYLRKQKRHRLQYRDVVG